MVIDTGSGLCCDCSLGASFVVGGRYLVGAYQSEGALLASSCNRPAYEGDDPERFAALLDRLGPGRAPLEATGERSHLGPTALGLLSALGLLAVGLLLLRLRAAFAVEASAPLPWRRARERVSTAAGRRRRPTDRCR